MLKSATAIGAPQALAANRTAKLTANLAATSSKSPATKGDEISKTPPPNYSSYLPDSLPKTVNDAASPHIAPFGLAESKFQFETGVSSADVKRSAQYPLNAEFSYYPYSNEADAEFLPGKPEAVGLKPLNIQLGWDPKQNAQIIAQDERIAQKNFDAAAAVDVKAGFPPDTGGFGSIVGQDDASTLAVLQADASAIATAVKHHSTHADLPEPIPTAPLPSAPAEFKGGDKAVYDAKRVLDDTVGKLL